MKPQENGSHYGCEYLKSENLFVTASQPFSFNLSPYTQEELTAKNIATSYKNPITACYVLITK
ncbi:beta-galactosidase/beta-glucuronidase [Actinobacillus equuli]|nr:beta-galactosidase/beta-glucuronidase [Actinobacillus equuli]